MANSRGQGQGLRSLAQKAIVSANPASTYGFLDRLLFSYAPPTPAEPEQWKTISQEARDGWKETAQRLWELTTDEDPNGNPRPHFLRLNKSGRGAWEEFTTNWAQEVNDSTFPAFLRGPWSKFKTYQARFSLLLHVLHQGESHRLTDVTGEDMERAAQVIAYFQAHARKVYGLLGADPRLEKASIVLRWVKREHRQHFTKREAHYALQGSFPTSNDLDGPLAVLCDLGHLRLAPPQPRTGPGRKPSPLYLVNPTSLQVTQLTELTE